MLQNTKKGLGVCIGGFAGGLIGAKLGLLLVPSTTWVPVVGPFLALSIVGTTTSGGIMAGAISGAENLDTSVLALAARLVGLPVDS